MTENYETSGKYDLKMKFYERLEDGGEREVACMLFTLRIEAQQSGSLR